MMNTKKTIYVNLFRTLNKQGRTQDKLLKHLHKIVDSQLSKIIKYK